MPYSNNSNKIHNPQGYSAMRDAVNLFNHHNANGIGNMSVHRYNLARRPNVNVRAVTQGIRMIPIHHRSM